MFTWTFDVGGRLWKNEIGVSAAIHGDVQFMARERQGSLQTVFRVYGLWADRKNWCLAATRCHIARVVPSVVKHL